MPSAVACSEKTRLLAEVQESLTQISELLRLERHAVEDEAEYFTRAIEGEINRATIEEEHTLAMLRQHCKKHGC